MLGQGKGPTSASELILYLAQYLTDKVQDLVGELTESVDEEEEKTDADERYSPEHGKLLHIRRRAAGLRRFLGRSAIFMASSRGSNCRGSPMTTPITGMS